MTIDTLKTPRLTLRAVRPEDVEDIHRHISDWDVVRMLALPPWPYTREDAVKFAAMRTGHAIEFENQVIGFAGIEKREGKNTLGYWIGRNHWGLGLMTEALTALVTNHFDQPAAEPLFSGYAFDNPASWRVQKKLGFVKVGEVLTYIVSRGEKIKEIKTRLTREEFEKASR